MERGFGGLPFPPSSRTEQYETLKGISALYENTFHTDTMPLINRTDT